MRSQAGRIRGAEVRSGKSGEVRRVSFTSGWILLLRREQPPSIPKDLHGNDIVVRIRLSSETRINIDDFGGREGIRTPGLLIANGESLKLRRVATIS